MTITLHGVAGVVVVFVLIGALIFLGWVIFDMGVDVGEDRAWKRRHPETTDR